jgi:hypothetical protein
LQKAIKILQQPAGQAFGRGIAFDFLSLRTQIVHIFLLKYCCNLCNLIRKIPAFSAAGRALWLQLCCLGQERRGTA